MSSILVGIGFAIVAGLSCLPIGWSEYEFPVARTALIVGAFAHWLGYQLALKDVTR
jgi:hypothetical protein